MPSHPFSFVHQSNKTLRSPTSIVHLEYDPKRIEPAPSNRWTRFVCISDSHARTFHVPRGDVLLHSGDLTKTGKFEEFKTTMDWLYQLPHNVKIIIAGNHDFSLHDEWYDVHYARWHQNIGRQSSSTIRDLLNGGRAVAAGIVYLQDEQYTFRVKENGQTWSVHGSPWSPAPGRGHWAFQYQEAEARNLISKISKTDILLTHSPPFGVFDRTSKGALVGCNALLQRLPDLRPRIHVMGHIHEAHGAHIHDWRRNKSGKFILPAVQNDEGGDVEQSHIAFSDEEVKGDDVGATDEEDDEGCATGTPESTVFVNAANSPVGRRSARGIGDKQKSVPFGGPGHQPIVVDLKDYPDESDSRLKKYCWQDALPI